MKTVILSLSPRKSFSASLYYSRVVKLLLGQPSTSIITLKTEQDYLAFEQQLLHIDQLVIASPVYVDTIPSTVLERLVRIEQFAQTHRLHIKVYALTNCGFYEGEQNSLAQSTISLWSEQCGFTYQGGLGIGAGVMLGFVRTLPLIGLAVETLILLIRALLCLKDGALSAQAVLNHYFPYTLIIQSTLYLLWSMGFLIHAVRLAQSIRTGKPFPVQFTTVWFCPRLLFVIIASTYWLAASLLWHHGPFWRLHKPPHSRRHN